MPSDLNTDVVVVGAGAVGASSVFHLARAGLRVVVVDAFDGPAEGSTGRSFASIRAQWADALNIELSWCSIQAYRCVPRASTASTSAIGPAATCSSSRTPPGTRNSPPSTCSASTAFPSTSSISADAQRITPFAPHGLAGATWGPADGVVDPHLADHRVPPTRAIGGRAGPVPASGHSVCCATTPGWTVTAGERRIRAQYVVNAAGGWAGELAALAGLTVPVVHSRRNIYATASGALDARCCR